MRTQSQRYLIIKKIRETFKWYKKAAENGNTNAMDEIANAYCYNRYRNDYAEAQRWYKKAAEKAIRMQWTKSQEYINMAMVKKR